MHSGKREEDEENIQSKRQTRRQDAQLGGGVFKCIKNELILTLTNAW